MKSVTLFLALALLLTACMPAQSVEPQATLQASNSTEQSPQESPMPVAETAIAPTTEATTEVASIEPVESSQNFLWTCFTCGGPQIWRFEDGEASLIDFPIPLGFYFGHTPATNRVLYTTPTDAIGGGPSQISVHDLWVLDVSSGATEPLFNDQVIVEAVWAPDGEQIAYIQATDATYELRWRGLNDEDKLLASDVAFTFAVSPNSDKVAFTRESNYNLPGQPGLYVVDVATGEELMISDTDRAGAGSIGDQPVWSPSGQYLLLPTLGTTAGGGIVRALADGSSAVTLQFDPALAAEEWFDADPYNPFPVSDTEFIASASVGGASAQMGGPSNVIYYQLNDTFDTIVNGKGIAEGELVGWDVPGQSVWIQTESGMQSFPLPEH